MELNVMRLSRTVRFGTVSLESTPDKAVVLESLSATPERLRELSRSNVSEALDLAQSLLETSDIRHDMKAVAEQVNLILTRGIVCTASPYRTYDVKPSMPYVSALSVPAYAAMFYQIIARSKASPADLAAFSIWAIDLRGHLFSDGCGKTATLISGMLLSQAGCGIPEYGSRDEYYAAPYDSAGVMSWRLWRNFFSSLSGSSS